MSQSATPLLREKHSLIKCSYNWICHWLPCNTVVLFYNFSPARSFFKLIRLCYMKTNVNKHWLILLTILNLCTCQIHNLTKEQNWAAHHLWKAQFKNVVWNYPHHQEYFIMLLTRMKGFMGYNFRILKFASLFWFCWRSSFVSIPLQQNSLNLSPKLH